MQRYSYYFSGANSKLKGVSKGKKILKNRVNMDEEKVGEKKLED
jgi:hypothetical protein